MSKSKECNALNKRLAESSSDVILADVSEGLADTQKEKFASLSGKCRV